MGGECNIRVTENIINIYTVSVRKSEEKILLGTSYGAWKKNITINMRQLEKDGFDSTGIR
jgi:hypothetical protein